MVLQNARIQKQQRQAVEQILSSNPGNYTRKKPMTVDFRDDETVYDGVASEKANMPASSEQNLNRRDSENPITNGDRLRVMTVF